MKTIVVTDIFGRTPELETLAFAIDVDSLIVDPYMGTDFGFQSENAAYQFFCAEVGLESYSHHLKQQITKINSTAVLIGFSIGASAIWRISDNPEIQNVHSATCFYGSQIRHHQHVTPVFPVNLIFPAKEKHFSITDLVKILKVRPNVQIRQSSFLHGFMNKRSMNFDRDGYDAELAKLKKWRSRIASG